MLIYRRAVKLANRAHAETGARYFVLPNVDSKILLIVTDRKNFRGLRQKHYIDPQMKMDDVFDKCFYYTPRSDGEGLISEAELKVKQIAYQIWYEERLKNVAALKREQHLREKEIRKQNRLTISNIKAEIRRAEKDRLEKESEQYERIRRKYRK